MKKLLSGLMALAISAVACSKSSSSTTNTSVTSSSLSGKWSIVNTIEWFTPIGLATVKDTTAAYPGEYVDFEGQGKAYSYIWDGVSSFVTDTATYVINGTQLIVTDIKNSEIDTSTIKNLTSNNLTIYSTFMDSTGTTQSWENFTK